MSSASRLNHGGRVALRELRLALEVASTANHSKWPELPPGAGRPVLLAPGLLAGDRSLSRMAAWLESGGWVPVAAHTGLTIDCSQRLLDGITRRLEAAVERSGGRGAVIGQSRGGLLARALAVQRPELVETVVTLGSPVCDVLDVHRMIRVQLRLLASAGQLGVPGVLSHGCQDGACCASFRDALVAPMPPSVRAVGIYSPTDSFVHARACLDPAAELRAVDGTHIGMAVSARVWIEIADALRADAPQALAA